MAITLNEMGPHGPIITRIAVLIIIGINMILLYHIFRYYFEYNSLLKILGKTKGKSEILRREMMADTSNDRDDTENRSKITNKDKNLFAILKNELYSLSLSNKPVGVCLLCKMYYSLITKTNILYSNRIKKLLSIILYASLVLMITLYRQFKEIHYIGKEISESVMSSRNLLMIFSDLFVEVGVMLFSVLILSYLCYIMIKKQYNLLLEKIDFFLSR